MIITLQRDGTCADCGASLPAGTRARWYRNGAVYGLDCHEASATRPARTRSARRTRRDRRTSYERGDRSAGAIASHYDRTGLYTATGERIGASCGCIDYPCCGH